MSLLESEHYAARALGLQRADYFSASYASQRIDIDENQTSYFTNKNFTNREQQAQQSRITDVPKGKIMSSSESNLNSYKSINLNHSKNDPSGINYNNQRMFKPDDEFQDYMHRNPISRSPASPPQQIVNGVKRF